MGGARIPDYALYGLTLSINAAVGVLRAAAIASVPDVHVSLRAVPSWAHQPVAEGGTVYRSEATTNGEAVVEVAWLAGREGIRIRYADGTTFHVRADAREIWATWELPLTIEDTIVYLVGPVMGYVLRRLGVLSLHASAVVIEGRAIAFCGDPGAGKSTTAAAFSANGFPLLTDDVLALRSRDGVWFGYPAYDHVRLWPTAARMLVGDENALPWLTPTWPKRAFSVVAFGAGLAADPLPLGAIFLLAARAPTESAPHVERASGMDAFVHLVARTSANYLLDAEMRAAELAGLADVMAHVPVFRLTPHADPEKLPQLLNTVLATVRA